MKLVIEDDEGNRQEIPVDGLDEITIGRAPGNTIQLDQRNVSRRHARLSAQSGSLMVEDLQSANGTLLNGERLTAPRALHDGDQLTIGDLQVGLAWASLFGGRTALGVVERKLKYNDRTGDHDVSDRERFAAISYSLRL